MINCTCPKTLYWYVDGYFSIALMKQRPLTSLLKCQLLNNTDNMMTQWLLEYEEVECILLLLLMCEILLSNFKETPNQKLSLQEGIHFFGVQWNVHSVFSQTFCVWQRFIQTLLQGILIDLGQSGPTRQWWPSMKDSFDHLDHLDMSFVYHNCKKLGYLNNINWWLGGFLNNINLL